MNGPATQPRAPFLMSNQLFLRDRMTAFASAGEYGDLISKRYPNG
jgi:hypothetical protein